MAEFFLTQNGIQSLATDVVPVQSPTPKDALLETGEETPNLTGYVWGSIRIPPSVLGVTEDAETFDVPVAGALQPTPVTELYPLSSFYWPARFTVQGQVNTGPPEDLGLVTQTFALPVLVQHTRGYYAEVEVLRITAGYGLSLSGVSVGDVFGPYEERQIDITVQGEGSPAIDAYLEVKFAGDAITYFLKITGTRAHLPVPLAANWTEGVTNTRRYLTSIQEYKDTSEQRKQLRDRPCIETEATLTYYGTKGTSQAWQVGNRQAAGLSLLPLYSDRSETTQVSVNDSIYCETKYRRFFAGSYATVVTYGRSLEVEDFYVVQIDTVEEGRLVCVNNLPRSFAKGSIVYPAMLCFPSFGSTTQSSVTDRLGTLAMMTKEVYGSTGLGAENPNYEPTVVQGYPVLEKTPNWVGEVTKSVLFSGAFVESGRGGYSYIKGTLPTHSTSRMYSFFSRESVWDFLGFLNHIGGMAKAFWMRDDSRFIEPSQYRGLEITLDYLTPGDWALLPAVWVVYKDGSYDILKVAGVEEDISGNSVVTLSETLGDGSTVEALYPAILSRLASDEVQERWITDQIAEVTLDTKELQGAYNG